MAEVSGSSDDRMFSGEDSNTATNTTMTSLSDNKEKLGSTDVTLISKLANDNNEIEVGQRKDDDDDETATTEENNELLQNPDFTEERFRVDRRKLEQLLLVTGDGAKNADMFFKEIMNETNTTIVWPAKLKIGAKSKKDPLIKVCGLKDNVSDATERIMNTLDTKSLRVTLKMEISHTEHSHVIGKGGSNIQRVMQETDCHIHFPDSNRNNQAEKSNQVSITGQCDSVERARLKLKDLLPLFLLFELPTSLSNSMSQDSLPAIVHHVQQRYGISIIIKQHPNQASVHGFVQTVIVRGSVHNSKAVEDASFALFEAITGSSAALMSVTLLLDIAPSHHLPIIGQNGSNIKQVIRATGATIYFPDAVTISSQNRNSLYITGTIPQVFLAKQQLLGFLPIVLMFDIKDDEIIDPGRIGEIMDQLEVYVMLKPKPKQAIKSVILKGLERNVGNLYEARKRLLSMRSSTTTSSTTTSSTTTLSTSRYSPEKFHPSRHASTNSTSELPSKLIFQSPATNVGGMSETKTHKCNSNPTIFSSFPSHPVYHPVIALPSSPSYRQPAGVFPTSGRLMQRQFSGGRVPVARETLFASQKFPFPGNNKDFLESDCNRALAGNLSWPSNLASAVIKGGLGSTSLTVESNLASDSWTKSFFKTPQQNLNNSRIDEPSDFFSQKGMENEHESKKQDVAVTSSPLDTDSLVALYLQNLQNLYANLDSASNDDDRRNVKSPHLTTTDPQPQRTGIYRADEKPNDPLLFGKRSNQPALSHNLSYENVIEIGTSNQRSPSSSHNFGQLPSPNNPDLSSSANSGNLLRIADNNNLRSKAPGGGRPRKAADSSAVLPNSDSIFTNLEEMKLLATRSVQQRPTDDSRTPTDYFSGLYFSKSMPDAALCDKINQTVLRSRGSRMYSNVHEDGDADAADPWGDALNASERTSIPAGHAYANPNAGHTYANQNAGHAYANPNAVDNADSANKYSTDEMNKSGNVDASELSELCKLSMIWQPMTKEMLPSANVNNLAELFCKLGLEKYTDLFEQQEIDLSTFSTLTENDLKELGISTFGARRKMLMAIADLNKRPTIHRPPPGFSNPFQDPSVPRGHDLGSQSGRW